MYAGDGRGFLQISIGLITPMSLKAAHSLSNGFENTLESPLHGVDGFFREHTTLAASEVIALPGGIASFLYQGGDYDLRCTQKDTFCIC